MIELRNLTYTIEGRLLLDHITDMWTSGQMVGIIGPNGSGKTTLLRHIYGAIPSDKAVYIDGVDGGHMNHHVRACQMAVVAQRSDEVEGLLTVRQVVQMGRYPYRNTLRAEEDEQVVNRVLHQMGIEELQDRRVHNLSGGEWQRALIAKALAQETEYIILDEPTNHLDIRYKLALMEQLKQFEGTVVLTLHDLILAGRYCDHIVAMTDGRIAYAGATAEVCTSQRLSEVFQVPMVVDRTEQGFIVTY